MSCRLAAKFGSPVFLNMSGDGIGPWNCSVESGLLADGSKDFPENLRGGILQEVAVNVPRIVLEAQGSEAKVFELLEERMELARRVLLLKRELMSARMREGSLSFPAQMVGSKRELEIDDQKLLFGVLGISEAVKIMTGSYPHESEEGLGLARRLLGEMKRMSEEYSEESGLRFDMCQSSSLEAGSRLARIDRRRFRKRFVAQGEGSRDSLYYTPGAQVPSSSDLPLEERIEVEGRFHALLSGGAFLNIPLEGVPDEETLWRNARRISSTDVILFAFTQDITLCLSCGALYQGLHTRCLTCNSPQIEWFSRTWGRYSRVGMGEEIGGWDRARRTELLSRKRYRI